MGHFQGKEKQMKEFQEKTMGSNPENFPPM